MEELSRRRKHLKTFFGRYAPLEDGQHLLQGPPREADSTINTPELRFAQSQANNPALHKAETRATDKTQ